MKNLTNVIVIGGGAAGLFCAGRLDQKGLSVKLIEHNSKLGRKLLISGGGRCNFTNLNCTAENYYSNNPHFCKSALSRYTQYDFIKKVQNYKIAYYEKTKGQLFCQNHAKDILDMLIHECQKGQVSIHTQTHVREVRKSKNFEILNENGIFHAKNVVIATGGLSISKIGASDLFTKA